MGLSSTQTKNVERILKETIRDKFENYNPEPALMPFHTRLLGKDRLALYKFIQSLNTSFGTRIYEPVALALASENFAVAKCGEKSGSKISSEAQLEIQKIMDALTTSTTMPNKPEEIERIRKVAQKGKMKTVKPTKVDLMLQTAEGRRFLFDLKTVKPNVGGFKEFKRTLLEWAAVVLAVNSEIDINTLIAIPYNPYAPKPYERWTMQGMMDLNHDILVAEDFWNFLGGENSYEDLLDCFERVGCELRPEIDNYFARFRNN